MHSMLTLQSAPQCLLFRSLLVLFLLTALQVHRSTSAVASSITRSSKALFATTKSTQSRIQIPPKSSFTTFINDFRSAQQRHLQDDNNSAGWEALNAILYNAVIHLPDTQLESAGLTLTVTNLYCTHVQVDSLTMSASMRNPQEVVVTTTIGGLDMTCSARYEFGGYLIVNGSGDLTIDSLDNSATVTTVFASVNYNEGFPPHDSFIESCSPQINIQRMDFSNGGFWGWTLETLQGMFRGTFESMAQDRLCTELEQLANSNIDQLLNEMQNYFVQYPSSLAIDPLASEQLLASTTNPNQTRLVNWQQPESYPFGFWMDEAWDDTVAYLNQRVTLENGSTDLNANVLLRQHVLDDNGGLIMNLQDNNNNNNNNNPQEDVVLYEGQDQWMKTRLVLDQIEMVGLDTLTALDPLDTIGNYTLQSTLSWEALSLVLKMTLVIQPSTLPDSFITGTDAAGIREQVTVEFGLSQVNADISILLALNQDDVEALQVGHFLDKNNFLSCFLSCIYSVEVSALTVQAMDLQPPIVSGLVSPGLSNVMSNAMQGAFLMYEAAMLKSSRAFFQTAVRQVVNTALQEQYESYGQEACQLWTLQLPPLAFIDVRDLLLQPNASLAVGGAGNGRYGTLFSEFVMPTVQREILSDDKVNHRFIRPWTKEQSGQEGSLMLTEPWIDFLREGRSNNNSTSNGNWVELLGWERFQFQALDAKIQNVDTIVTPLEVVQPVDSRMLSNVIHMGNATTTDRPLLFSTVLSLWGKGREDQKVKDMTNEVQVSLSIPSSALSFDALVTMNETSLLHFPLGDLENKFCWLASLSQDAKQPGLDMEKIVASMSSFTFDVACVACSSPGGEALPEIMDILKQARFASLFQPYFEELFSEIAQGTWDNMNFAAMIRDAPRLCPHHPEYDPQATAGDFYGLSAGMAAPPQWSRRALETISAVGFLSLYTGLFVLAKNYLLQPEIAQEPVLAVEGDGALNQSLADIASKEVLLLDWTNLSSTLGPWADKVLDQARQALQESVTNESIHAKRRLNVFKRSDAAPIHGTNSRFLEANTFVRDYLLDDDGSMSFAFDDMKFEFAGIFFSLERARLFGIDTITNLDPFIAVGPQTLENKIQLDQLVVNLEVGVRMGQELNNMTLEFGFRNVTVELPLLLAMDVEKLGQFELERVLKVGTILPCLLPGAQKVYIPKLNVSVGTTERPVIGGFLAAELQAAVLAVNEALFDTFGNDLALALPGIFDTGIRRSLNTKLDQYVAEQDPSLCMVDARGGTVDFRDLFLPENEAKSLGGSGKSPYGDLFQTLHKVLKEELATDENTRAPTINSLLSAWTADISNVNGALHVDGDLIDTEASVKISGLDAVLAFRMGNISILNIDSLGSPLAMLDPLNSTILNNTLSFGIGPDPLRVAVRLMLSLTDDDEMQVRNEIEVNADLYSATVVFTLLLIVLEDALLSFPLRDISNFHCWLATIIPSSEELSGFVLEDISFAMERLDLNVTCVSCTSPQFGDLVLDLYGPKNPEDATNTVVQTFGQVLDGEAIQDFFDKLVIDSTSKCPHSENYDPSASDTATEELKNAPDAFGFTDFSVRDSKSSYFNIASGIFACLLLISFIVGKLLIRGRNKKWKDSLSTEGMLLLRQQKAREQQQEYIINLYSTSLFQSPHIPKKIRWLVPIAILINIGLYMGGHLGVLSTVNVDVQLAGEEFTIHDFLVFSFLKSTATTYQNGGMEMSIVLWIFTGVWPYVKLLASLFLWLVPPKILSVSYRGKLLLWIDTLTKLSIIDIFTMILVLAVLLVYIGGPDEALSANGALYAMKVIVIPGAGCYCIVIGQRMSRVSSRFFLEYHDQVVVAAREAYQRGDITEVYNSGSSETKSSRFIGSQNTNQGTGWGEGGRCQQSLSTCSGVVNDNENADNAEKHFCVKPGVPDSSCDSIVPTAPGEHPFAELQRSGHSDVEYLRSHGASDDVEKASGVVSSSPQITKDHQNPSIGEHKDLDAPEKYGEDDGMITGSSGRPNHFSGSESVRPSQEHSSQVSNDKECSSHELALKETIEAGRCSSCFCWSFLTGHVGVAFGAITVLVLLIIGCIYAPSVAVEVSDLWGLALESGTTYAEVVASYGVFSVVSAILLKSQFVLNSTWDYIALGFLLAVAALSIGMVLLINCYRFFKRMAKDGRSALWAHRGAPAFELPSYLRLYAYKNIEIYVVSVVIGCWQLGSVSIYAIHLYCSILDAVYKILTYIGLAEPSTAQCFQSQMMIVDNLLIFCGALLILLTNFWIQCSKQYRKNINEACDLLRHDDLNVENLSSHWNTTSTRSLKRSPWNKNRRQVQQLHESASFSASLPGEEGTCSNSNYRTARSSSPFLFGKSSPPSLPLEDTFSLSSNSGSPSGTVDSGSPGRVWDQRSPTLGSSTSEEDQEDYLLRGP